MASNAHKEILNIALPSILSNITVPLLGLVDIAIVGHLGSASHIGAIAIGTTIFNMIYWIFAFFRMGTSGMTSQAYGAGNKKEIQALLYRSLLCSLAVALIILVSQIPLREFSLIIMSPDNQVKAYAIEYFNICIWGAPAMLGLYCITGWLLGLQNARYPLYIAISQNIVNIICSLFFVYVMKWNVAGVAYGTVIAQYLGLILSLLLCYKTLSSLNMRIKWISIEVLNKKSIQRFFSINSDIFFRTLCLVIVTVFFTAAGSRQGDVILAVNALLMQFFTLYSYFMDGFAFAGEALMGKYVGAKDETSQHVIIKSLFVWGCAVASIFTLTYTIGGTNIIYLLTDEQSVRVTAKEFLSWVVCIPLVGLSAFIWDGIYIGLTATKQMLYSMFIAMTGFFITYFLLRNHLNNHALWISFLFYLFTRGIVQHIIYKKLFAKKL